MQKLKYLENRTKLFHGMKKFLTFGSDETILRSYPNTFWEVIVKGGNL